MTPADFAREIVIPTVEDLRADRTSRRWAYLSAIAVYHLRDHLAEALATPAASRRATGGAIERELARTDEAVRGALSSPDLLDVVRAVANGSKHAFTRSPRGPAFVAGTDEERPSVLYGEGAYGVGIFGGIAGREIAHDGAQLDLYQAIAATLSAFLTAFPAEFAGCTFDPFLEDR